MEGERKINNTYESLSPSEYVNALPEILSIFLLMKLKEKNHSLRDFDSLISVQSRMLTKIKDVTNKMILLKVLLI